MRQITDAFTHLHSMSVIHRDIKPSNILLHNSDFKIGDFGFARMIQNIDDMGRFSEVGTPYYMSP